MDSSRWRDASARPSVQGIVLAMPVVMVGGEDRGDAERGFCCVEDWIGCGLLLRSRGWSTQEFVVKGQQSSL